MAEIKLQKRYKYAGDIMPKLLDIGFDLETASDFLNNIPDADVVPRAEVAREIFEEIEAEITEALKCNYKRRTEYYTQERFKKEDRDFINTVNGKIDALRGIEGFLAELKKKYTEGQK